MIVAEKFTLVDTNVFIRNLGKDLSSDEIMVIPYPVLQELDRIKTFSDHTGKQARDAIHFIYDHMGEFKFWPEDLKDNEIVDDYLIRVALEQNFTLRTYDLNLYLKAQASGVDAIFNKENDNELYEGISYLTLEQQAKIQQGAYSEFKNLPENHYLIGDKQVWCMTNGQPEEVRYGKIKNSHQTKEIKARSGNLEQVCLIDALIEDVPIVVATGGFGTGKSYLLLNSALQKLENGTVDRIVVIPNNSYVEGTRELGTLPGGLLEKEMVHLGPLIDLVDKNILYQMVENHQIEVLPMSVARGRNLKRAVVFVSEAQNLSEEHMKLLVGRIAEDSFLYVDGDIKQSDKAIYKVNSGIKLLSKLAKTEFANMIAVIKLKNIERSKVARLADELDKL